MIRKHFILEDDILKIIDKYRLKYGNISYSKTLSELVRIANDSLMIQEQIQLLKESIEKVLNYNYLELDLIKQLYSDLEIQNSTNPNKNKSLQNFFKNRNSILDE